MRTGVDTGLAQETVKEKENFAGFHRRLSEATYPTRKTRRIIMLRRRIYGDTLRRISEAIETAHKDLFGLKEDRFLTFVREHKR